MKASLLLACSALGLSLAGAVWADPQTDEANRQRQMAGMQAEAARNDRISADRSLAQQRATQEGSRASSSGGTPSPTSGSSGGSSGLGASGGYTDNGPQSVVDSYTIVIRTQETPQQMMARLGQEAAQGDTGAQYNLGRIYYTGFNDAPRDDAKARDYFRQAAQAGHAASQANYGYFLTEGIGGSRDASEGVRWLKTAADAGNSFGQAQYGMSLVLTDAAEAARFLIQAANAGEVAAQAMMGTFYAMGEGVARDDALAVRFLKAASDQGEAGSTGLLAGMYLTNRGGTEAEGVELLRQAAEAGDPASQMNYGLLLVQGNLVAKDELAGAALVRRAAYSGNNPARSLLGDLYNEGLGVPEEGIDAIFWWNLAAQEGDESAIARMAQVRAGGNEVGRSPTEGTGPVASGGSSVSSGTRDQPVVRPNDAPSPTPAGTIIQGELSNIDAKLQDGSFYDCHAIQTSAGTSYRAVMRSDAFDTFLSVGGGDCAGTAAISDDDGAGGTNSAVNFTGDGRRWFLRANSLSPDVRGAYTLEIAEMAQLSMLVPGQAASGELAITDSKLSDGSFYDCYPVQTSRGTSYQVVMRSSDFDAYLSAGSGQCSGSASVSDDDGAGGTNSSLAFTGDGQTWFVRTNSVEGNVVGTYTVDLSERSRNKQ
ncbi:tetratricopeptide repeat protein [Brevundimonas sp. TWP2-3-4b2]|uniref:tetratricopeptide repeat protein n=1 Tax=Brevundimonas sp. TWP2-3-4b2 TaxID=2804595 RepID=UPI003CF30A8F